MFDAGVRHPVPHESAVWRSVAGNLDARAPVAATLAFCEDVSVTWEAKKIAAGFPSLQIGQ